MINEKDKDEEKPEPQAGAESGEKPPLTVDLTEDDDREEKPEPQQQGKSRSPDPRRKSEWRQFKESHEATVAALQRKIEDLERRPQQQFYQPPPQPKPDKGPDLEKQIDDIWEQQQLILRNVNPEAPAEEKAKAAELWRKLGRQRAKLERQADDPRAEPAAGDDIPAENRRLGEFVQDEFPEIAGDQSLALEAEAELLRILRQPGRVKSRATVREACDRVKSRHGIGRRAPAPTDLESGCQRGRQRSAVLPEQAPAAHGACVYRLQGRHRR